MRFPGHSFLSPAKAPEVAQPAPIPEPTLMPDPDDKAIKREKERKFARTRARRGRMSTQNTGPDNQSTVLG